MYTQKQIAEKVGKSAFWVWKTRKLPEYQDFVDGLLLEMRQKFLDNASTVEDLFDAEVRPSIDVIRGVRDDLDEKGDTRVKAALAFIDRAPSSPKAKQEIPDKQVIINIPIKQLETMKTAFEEEGETKLLEMVQNVEGSFEIPGVQKETEIKAKVID